MSEDVAIGAAIHHDFELAADAAPFETLVRELFGASSPGGEYVHWFTPLKGKRTPPPPAFDLSKLVRIVQRGVASAAAETRPQTMDPDRMLVVAGTRPRSADPDRFTMTKCRYQVVIGVGPKPLRRLGIQRVIDAVVAFADAVDVRAGVIHCASTSVYATALASCGGTGLSWPERDHVTDLMYFQPRWGEVIRGPAWGTFLGAAHVERLGGSRRLESAPCARVSLLRSGGGYLQTTSSEQPGLEGAEAAKSLLDQLTLFLDPVVGHRPTSP